jgi:two-component system alkaline phosphatase synthesis response regulator PhoP
MAEQTIERSIIRAPKKTKRGGRLMASGSGHTVLVVDDNPDLCAFVAESLRKLGDFTVVTAEDGIQGLERYFAVRPDCVVIDVLMPGLDGYQLIHALRGDPDSSSTPLVILSAMEAERYQLAGLLSGVDEYLVKPVGPLDLVRTIEQVIARSAEERRRRLRVLLDETGE